MNKTWRRRRRRALFVLTFRIVSRRRRRRRRRKLFQSVDVGSWDGPHATQKEYAYFSLNMEEWSIDRRRIAASRPDGRAITLKLLGSTFLFWVLFRGENIPTRDRHHRPTPNYLPIIRLATYSRKVSQAMPVLPDRSPFYFSSEHRIIECNDSRTYLQ